MSYWKDLDEYTWSELMAEVDRRVKAQNRGLCDYCRRPTGETNPCKFPSRHRGEL